MDWAIFISALLSIPLAYVVHLTSPWLDRLRSRVPAVKLRLEERERVRRDQLAHFRENGFTLIAQLMYHAVWAILCGVAFLSVFVAGLVVSAAGAAPTKLDLNTVLSFVMAIAVWGSWLNIIEIRRITNAYIGKEDEAKDETVTAA